MKVSEKKKLKYETILKVSESLMKKDGVESFNLDIVARESKIAKGTLYLYFKSKEEIISKLALKARQKLLEDFKHEIDTRESSTDKLKGIVDVNYRTLKQNQVYYDLVSFYEKDERETETVEMQRVVGEILNLVIEIIKDGKLKNEIRASINPFSYAFSMWGMTVGVMQMIKTKADIISRQEIDFENQILGDLKSAIELGVKK